MSFHSSAGVYVGCRTFCTSVQNVWHCTVTMVSRCPWYEMYLESCVVCLALAVNVIRRIHVTSFMTTLSTRVLQSIVCKRHSSIIVASFAHRPSFPFSSLIVSGCCALLCHTHRRICISFITLTGNKQLFGCSRNFSVFSIPSWRFVPYYYWGWRVLLILQSHVVTWERFSSELIEPRCRPVWLLCLDCLFSSGCHSGDVPELSL